MTFNNSNELKEYLKCQEDLYCPALELFVTVSANWIVCSMKCSLPEAKESVYLSLKNRTYSLPHTAFVNTDLFEINDFCGKYFNKEWMSWPDFSDSVLINDTKNRKDYDFSEEIQYYLENLQSNWFPELHENMDPVRGAAVLEIGYVDIELNIHSIAQITDKDYMKENFSPVCSYFCCIKHGDSDDDWESDDYIDESVNVDWNAENWREQLENDMIVKLHKYAAMKGYSFNKAN